MNNHSLQKKIKLNCRQLSLNQTNQIADENVSVRLYHKNEEPQNANRLEIEIGKLKAEVFPSKGLSLGQVFYDGKKIFWEAPYLLPDPDKLDLWSDEILINGTPMEGFTYLKTFAAGVEFYGLKNWGMPRRDEQTGELFPLHGETSNIPVEEVTINLRKNRVEVVAEFIYHDMKSAEHKPWYKGGSALYKVKKYVAFQIEEKPGIILRDTIENISGTDQVPDWGYHVTFFPNPGSKLLVPSKSAEERNGEILPNDIETWNMAGKGEPRQETGIIHKNLRTKIVNNTEKCNILVQHPDGEGIHFKFPPSPYFQTWSCKGGAGSDEFRLKNGTSLLVNNWDGLGIEFGSSALDHDENIDHSVNYDRVLPAGKQKTIEMELTIADPVTVLDEASSINEFNKNRRSINK